MPKLVEVTEAFAKSLNVHRLEEGGYQRKLRYERTEAMVKNVVKNKLKVPPIIVHEIKDKLFVVDGQHRLHSWNFQHYPLQALIYEGQTHDDSARDFVAINGTSKRVGAMHRIQVDPSQWGKDIRALAKKFDIDLSQSWAVLRGVCGHQRKAVNVDGTGFSAEEIERAEEVLEFWTSHPKWKEEVSVFSSLAVLMMIARMAGRHERLSAKHIMTKLSKMDFSKHGQLGIRCGSSFSHQDQMQTLAEKFLTDKL